MVPAPSILKPLKISQNLSKISEKPPSQRPSQRQISLSEALGPVAPIVLPLKLSPSLLLGIIGVSGVFGISFFCCGGGLGTPWVGGRVGVFENIEWNLYL